MDLNRKLMIAHGPNVNPQSPGAHKVNPIDPSFAYQRQGRFEQPPPTQVFERHVARGIPTPHMPIATGDLKRKGNIALSPISSQSSQVIHVRSQEGRRSKHVASLTSSPVYKPSSHYYSGTTGKQNAALFKAQPVSDAPDLLCSYQIGPSVSHSCQGLLHPCHICMALDPSDQMAEVTWDILNEVYPSFTPLEPPTPQGLQSLPPEIIHRLCEYLTEWDVGNFRRTSQKHAAIGDEHLFRQGTLRMNINIEHFDRLQAISNNPMICQRIKTLELVGEQHGLTRLLFPWVFPTDPWIDLRGYSKLQLQRCVQHLKNLQAIDMRIDVQHGSLMTPQMHTQFSEQMYLILSDIQDIPGIDIKYLKANGVGWHSPCCVSARSSESVVNLKSLEDAAGRLRRLDITVKSYPQDSGMAQCAALVHYLRLTKNLQEIRLIFGKSGFPRFVNLVEVCRLRWNHLRSVELTFATVQQDDLLSFFEAHSDLKEIRLGSMSLRLGSWTTVITRMSEIFHRLERLNLSGALYDAQHINLGTFVCGDHMSRWAHEAVVNKQRGLRMMHPPQALAVVQAAVFRDRELQRQRRAAGLPCDVCRCCGCLKESY